MLLLRRHPSKKPEATRVFSFGNNTSGTGPGGTSVILDPCSPTAVTVNSFDANSDSLAVLGANGLGILGPGLAGVFTLGLAALFAIRRK